MKTNINQAAARRLVEMELGEADEEFGFSVEDIEAPQYEDSKYVSFHSLIWKLHESGNFYELAWSRTKEDDPENLFEEEEGLIWCPQVVPEWATTLTWKRI